ncbi:MAG: hypothetical protein ACRDH5_01195 [bacterium]
MNSPGDAVVVDLASCLRAMLVLCVGGFVGIFAAGLVLNVSTGDGAGEIAQLARGVAGPGAFLVPISIVLGRCQRSAQRRLAPASGQRP